MRHALVRFVIALSSLLLASCDQKTVDIPAVPDPIGWTTLDEFDRGASPTTVWGSGANDVYVGYSDYYSGQGDVLRHFDGAQWAPVPLADDVRAVGSIWGSGPGDVYAATSGGIWHFDGSTWSPTGILAYGVTGHDADQVLAVNNTQLFRFNGAQWDTLLTISKPYTYVGALWAGPGSSVVAYLDTYPDADSLIRYNGTSWSPAEPAPGRIHDFFGSSPDDLVAVGGDANGAMAWQWDGLQWTPMTVPPTHGDLYDAYELSPGDVYAAGCDLLHYDGNSWQMLYETDEECFRDIWASGASDVYAVSHALSHYDGNGWGPVFPVEPVEPNAIWADSRGRVVVAGDRVVYRLENGAWREEGRQNPWGTIYSLAGRAWDDLYAGTSTGIFHGDGEDWTLMPDSPGGVETLFVLPTGELVATDRFRVFRHDSSGWTQIRNVLDEEKVSAQDALWAFGAHDILSGDRDGISRFNGVSWTRIDDEPCLDLLAFSPHDVFTLGLSLLRHSDGGPFERVGPVMPGWAEHVTGTSPDHIIVVGREGYMAYHDGQWVVGSEPLADYNIALVPAANDGSILRLDRVSRDLYRILYHR